VVLYFYLAPQSVDCGANCCVASVGGGPDQGVEAVIVLACGPAQIGVEFLGAKLGGGKGEAHIFLVGGFAFLGPAHTDLDALGEDAVVWLSACRLIEVAAVYDFL
jgi:hypothetical protein